jgi:hypothetical protein
MLEELQNIKEKVKFILDKYHSARDSDKVLYLFYLSEFHNLKNHLGEEKFLTLFNLITTPDTPSPESIRRIRQRFQETGLYLGEKRRKRMEEKERVRQWVKDQKRKGQENMGQESFLKNELPFGIEL